MYKIKRNISKTLTAIILIISILVLGTSQFIAYASETESYDTCAEHYFTQLENDVPHNRMGSCVYVAMSMLLSFYDFYWNDLFISQDFERDLGVCVSNNEYPLLYPAINVDNSSWDTYEDSDSYITFINNYKSEYLHLYLISLGIELGYHSSVFENETYGISLYEAKQVLDRYFTNINLASMITVNYIEECDTVTKNDVLNVIRSKVAMGIPTFYQGFCYETDEPPSSIDPNSKSGHMMVAYALTNNDIKLHTGWLSNSYTTVNTTDYQYCTGALWLEINTNILRHICSEKFQEITTSKNICSCQAYYSLHPEHTHMPLTVVRNTYTYTAHTAKCICGTFIETPHKYTYENLGSNHSYSCSCGYGGVTAHNLVAISPKYMRCEDCGYMFDRNSGGFIPNPLEWEGEEIIT